MSAVRRWCGCCRCGVADWVVRFSTSSLVQGFDYARQQGAHVLTMSMGGLSSAALVDAVNLAYEQGVFMVTAAGNNITFAPTPNSIVFPAATGACSPPAA